MIDNEAKAICAERELRYRKRVYRTLVQQGRMKASLAEYEIMIMQAIAEDYRRMADADEAEARLL